jgi:hypothetical protein
LRRYTYAHAYTDANTHPYPNANAYANTNTNTYPNSNPYANANADTSVRRLGRGQNLHRWPGSELSRYYLQSAVDPHRLCRHQLESEGHANLVDDRWDLQHYTDAYAYAYAYADANPDSDTNANAYTDANSYADSYANRHEETGLGWLHARKLRKRFRLYPYG